MKKFLSRLGRKSQSNREEPKEPTSTMREVEAKFLSFNHHVEPHYICNCKLCEKYFVYTPLKEEASIVKLKETATYLLNKKSNMKTLLTELCPKKGMAGLKIQIPYICFFEDGEAYSLFMTSKEEVRMLTKGHFTNRQIVHTFLEQKRLYKEALKEKYESSIMKHVELSEVHEKYTNMLLPIFKPGKVEYKQGFKHLKVHKDPKQMMDSLVQHQNKDTDEVCLVKRLDGGFELLNEIQFISIMKNKYTYKIYLIQSYIRPKKLSNCILHSEYYSVLRIANPVLYEKAKVEVDITLNLINHLSPSWMSRYAIYYFYVVLRETPEDYALYQTYKIIHYLRKAVDIETKVLKLGWLLNDVDLFYLYSVSEFTYVKVFSEQDDKLTKLEYERAKDEIKNMEGVQNWLLEKWDSIKKAKKIGDDHLVVKPPDRSAIVFKMLHPGQDYNILMDSDNFYDKVKKLTDRRSSPKSPKSRPGSRGKMVIENPEERYLKMSGVATTKAATPSTRWAARTTSRWATSNNFS